MTPIYIVTSEEHEEEGEEVEEMDTRGEGKGITSDAQRSRSTLQLLPLQFLVYFCR